jgi:hypothetical protein
MRSSSARKSERLQGARGHASEPSQAHGVATVAKKADQRRPWEWRNRDLGRSGSLGSCGKWERPARRELLAEPPRERARLTPTASWPPTNGPLDGVRVGRRPTSPSDSSCCPMGCLVTRRKAVL